MFEKQISRWVALGASAALTFPTLPSSAAYASANHSLSTSLEPERSLQDCITNVTYRAVNLGFEPLKIAAFNPEKSAEAQAIINRWAAYSKEIRSAKKEGSDPLALSQAQSSFVDWVKAELHKLNIQVPQEDPKMLGKFPELSEQIRYLEAGLKALCYHYGMVPDGCPREVIKDSGHADSFIFVCSTPVRLYRVIEYNPTAWQKVFPALVKDDVPLVAVTFMSGRDYARGPGNRIQDKCSFMNHGIAFIDLTAIQGVTETLKERSDKHIRNWLPLIDLPFHEFTRRASRDSGLLPEPNLDPVVRIKNGGAAFDCLVTLAGTDRCSHEFNWESIEGQRVSEYISHEGAHAIESRPTKPRDQLLSRLARGSIEAIIADKSEAETLLEIGVRLESMRHSLSYVMELLNDQRAGYIYGKDFNGSAAKSAQMQIFAGIEAELREHPETWGVEFENKTVEVNGVTFTQTEQILAQFHRFARTSETTNLMVDKLLVRLKVEDRKDALAAKYGYTKPQTKGEDSKK